MPIYEYRCESCKKQVEELQRMTDPPPTCCDQEMKKLMSATSFILAGTGWARDGYGDQGGRGGGGVAKSRKELNSIPTVTRDGGLHDPTTNRPILNPDGSRA